MAQLTGIARLGRDAEVRFTKDGDPVTTLSLAFTFGKRDPNTKERQTQWVKADLWGKRGQDLAPHLLKGSMVYVVLDDAHIQEFKKSDGSLGVALAGRVATVEFASRPATGSPQAPAPQQRQQDAPAQRQASARPASDFSDIDSDLPF